MNKTSRVTILFMLWVMCMGNLCAASDIVVQLRLYEGFNENGHSTGVIVSSYYLKKLPDSESQLAPFVGAEKEKEALIRIYKLKKVSQVAGLDLVLNPDQTRTQGHEILLNGRQLWLVLKTIPNQKDRFSIVISEKGKQNVLLESEIIVAEEKSAVLGFKDAADKIYFLAFNRKKQDSLAQSLNANTVEPPKLLTLVEPEYPAQLVQAGITGEVVVMGETDLLGKISTIQILDGHPLLAVGVKKAVSKWRYSPWKVDGTAKPVSVILIFIFRVQGQSKTDTQAIVKKYDALIASKKVKKELPWLMEVVEVNGVPVAPKKEETLAQRLNAKTVETPKLVHRIEPLYPPEAKAAKIQGSVVIKAITDTTGRVAEVQVLVGAPELAEKSQKAVSQWVYTPWKIDGVNKPVEIVWILIFQKKQTPPANVDALINQELARHKTTLDTLKKQGNRIPVLQEVVFIEDQF